MRQWAKSNVAGLDNPSVLRDLIQKQDIQLHELSAAVKLLGLGRVPTATDTSIGGGVTDHGLLTGLADDDHLQYLLLTGRTGGQVLLSADSTAIPLTIRGGSNSTIAVQQWGDQANTTTLDIFSVGGGTPAISLRTDTGTGLNLTAGGSTIGLQISSAGSQFIGGKFGAGALSSSTTLLSVDAANMSAVVADSDDNIRIIRRSGTQTGYALRLMEQTRTTTLAGITPEGYFVSPRLQLSDATGDLLTIVPATATTAHTLTMPAAQGGASTFLQNDGSGNLSWATAGGGGAHAILSTAHSDAVASAVSRGSLIYGNATPAWDELAVGTANTVLVSDGTDVSWSAISSAHITNRTRYLFIPPDAFGTAARSLIGSNPDAVEALGMSGAGDTYFHTNFQVPADYASGAQWKVHWVGMALATASAWCPRLIVMDMTGAVTTATASASGYVTATIASAGYTHMVTTGFTLPDSQTYTPGNIWRATIGRNAVTNGGDTYGNNTYVLGLELQYTADS